MLYKYFSYLYNYMLYLKVRSVFSFCCMICIIFLFFPKLIYNVFVIIIYIFICCINVLIYLYNYLYNIFVKYYIV